MSEMHDIEGKRIPPFGQPFERWHFVKMRPGAARF